MGKNKYKKTKLENTIVEIYPPINYILLNNNIICPE